MPTLTYKSLTSEDVKYEIVMEPEIEGFRGEFSDEECQDWIQKQLEAGNQWAWCSVTVRVSWGGFSVVAGPLGACSYESEEGFKEGGYYEDMKKDALGDLNSNLEQMLHDLMPRIEVKR